MTQAEAPLPASQAAPTPSKGAGKSKPSSGSDAATNGEKKPRAPRQDYGYAVTSIIHLVKDKEAKFTGKRADYYKLLVECDGKSVNDFEGAAPKDDSPRGWLRFFAQNGNCTLERVKAADPEPAK